MRRLFRHMVLLAGLLAASSGSAAGGAGSGDSYYADRYQGQEIAELFGCLGYCHRLGETKDSGMGPSFAAIAEKYKGNPGAASLLLNNVLHGSKNVWGKSEMLPQSYAQEADLKIIVDWILAQ